MNIQTGNILLPQVTQTSENLETLLLWKCHGN